MAKKIMVKSFPEWMFENVSDYRGEDMSDEIVKRGAYWHTKQRKYKGTMIPRQSLKTKDEEQARDRLLEIKLLIRQGVYQNHLKRFDKLFAEYKPKVDAKNKLRNVRVHMMPLFKGKRLSEIDIQSWAEMIAETKSEQTAISIIRPAKEMGFAIDTKKLMFNKGKRFDGSQIVSEELALKVADTVLPKYRSLCLVALYSAMPLSDLIHLQKRDVKFTGEDAGITYKRRKTRRHDRPTIMVPMTNKLRKAFSTMPTPFQDDGYWFPKWTSGQVTHAVEKAFRKCGWIHGRAVHNFRHAAACHLIRHGCDLVVIKDLLGHKDFNTTLIYARVDREKIKEGVAKFDNAVEKS